MNKNLTCNQVSALLNFYIEGKLNPRLQECVNKHLEKCPACKKKVSELRKIFDKFKNNMTLESGIIPEKMTDERQKFLYKLSEYMDNELSTEENIKIKKMAISNPMARKDLETLCKYKKALYEAYQKTKSDSKVDYSRNIMAKIQDSYDYTTNYFYKLVALFVVLVFAIIAGFLYLYF